MKKILMSASALAFVFGAAGSAHADAEWSGISLGGGFDMFAVYGQNDLVSDENEGFDFVYGNGGNFTIGSSIVTDSGIEYGASYGAGDDTGSGYVSGSFGKITVGEIDGASSSYSAGFSNAGVLSSATNEDFYPLVVPGAAGEDPTAGIITPAGTGVDEGAVGAQYDLPSFSGFSAGISYQRCVGDSLACGDDAGSGNATYGTKTNGNDDVFQVGAGYGTSFGGADVNFGAGYNSYTDDIHLSGNASMGGFRVGGGVGLKDGNNGYEVGVGYETGPWNTSIAYAWDESGDDTGIAVNVDYDLAPGVTAVAFGGQISGTPDANGLTVGTAGNTYDATVFGAGLQFSF